MQALLALPAIADAADLVGWERRIFARVAGVPLLARVIKTAAKAGASSVLIVHPRAVPEAWLRARLPHACLAPVPIRYHAVDQAFDPRNPGAWARIAPSLDPTFLWLPWNHVTISQKLAELFGAGEPRVTGARLAARGRTSDDLTWPAIVVTNGLLATGEPRLDHYLADPSVEVLAQPPDGGVAVTSRESRRAAVRLLTRGSGKPLDGFYSNFNRRLCRPLVRALSQTPVTANMVTWAGLPIVLLAGYLYAQGAYGWYVLGGLVYYTSVLFDEMDGMLARIKFQMSPFGCWLESFVDYASYLSLWTGMTIGLSRQHGDAWLVVGALAVFGNLVSFAVAIRHRKLSTRPDAPQKHCEVFYARLEADSANFVSRAVRYMHPLIKRGVFSLYVVIFSLLGAVHVFLVLVAIGANVTWLLGLYTTRLYRDRPRGDASGRQDSAVSFPAR